MNVISAGLLTRDPRTLERMKPGKVGARKKPLWLEIFCGIIPAAELTLFAIVGKRDRHRDLAVSPVFSYAKPFIHTNKNLYYQPFFPEMHL